jgi:3'-phosphoadenosine 5'-phosphosulfate (PAPS) 3'-phosphatase
MLFTAISFAQHKPDWEKIKSLKVAFITEKLSLSSKEAQEFWPVYNAYEEKRDALRKKEHNQIRSKIRDAESLSEKESAQLLKQYLQLEEEEEELDKEFLKEISTVISSKKTLLLLRAEEDFKRQLIKQYRHNKGGR